MSKLVVDYHMYCFIFKSDYFLYFYPFDITIIYENLIFFYYNQIKIIKDSLIILK